MNPRKWINQMKGCASVPIRMLKTTSKYENKLESRRGMALLLQEGKHQLIKGKTERPNCDD